MPSPTAGPSNLSKLTNYKRRLVSSYRVAHSRQLATMQLNAVGCEHMEESFKANWEVDHIPDDCRVANSSGLENCDNRVPHSIQLA